MMTLNTEPGANCAWIALFSSGFPGIGHQAVPLVAADAHRKRIGIERRTAHHRQNFSGARIHGDNRARLAFQRLLGGDLQIEINRELELLARNRRNIAQRADFLAAAVHQHLARAVLAHQNIVVVLLDSRHANHVARVVELPLRLGQHLFAHLADIADHVRHEAALGIQAAMHRDDVEFRQVGAVRLDEGKFVRRDVVFQKQRLVARDRRHALQARAQFVGRNVQSFGDLVGIDFEIAVLVAQQQHGERGVVVNDDAAFAVEQLAARREDGDLLDAVLFGQRAGSNRCALPAAATIQTREIEISPAARTALPSAGMGKLFPRDQTSVTTTLDRAAISCAFCN